LYKLAILFYNIFLFAYTTGIRVAAIWNNKARQWISGRKNIFEQIAGKLTTNDLPITWVHCSSLGEFEQGRPVIEELRAHDRGSKILLTFFSPSGYEIRKNFKGADWVFYLPMDSAANAKEFMDMVRPQLVIFIKYDYWYYYLNECKKRAIPLLMVSAIFRKEQPFFRWYGALHRKMLNSITHFFVQDKESAGLLKSIGGTNVTISGDTRFDRVAGIAENFEPVDGIEKFCGGSRVLVAGSTWPADEKIIREAITDLPDLKVIIAPHEIHKEHLNQLQQIFRGSILYSQFSNQLLPVSNTRSRNDNSASNYLIIDNIGMLSRLYRYATITYVGGGFDKGIHNTLEAAVYGKPVLFGPNYKKFREAIGLIEAGGGISIISASELKTQLENLLNVHQNLEVTGKKSFDFVQHNKGATKKIMRIIQENLRLTK
jgi:3-deoxy-D-manno-octulosonic-acid transferase